MRILYFSRDYTTHDHRFLASLAGSGHEPYFLRLEKRGLSLEDRPLPSKVTIVPWAGGRGPARLRQGLGLLLDLKRVIRKVRPDLIHAGPIQTAGLLTALSGFHPFVAVSWGSDLLRDADRNSLWRWATRYTLRRGDALIGDCQTVREKAISLGYPPDRIVTFPWGVDIKHFKPMENSAHDSDTDSGSENNRSNLRDRMGWRDRFILLSTRGWEPIYGLDVLAQAFVQAARQRPELGLLLLGGGSQAQKLYRIFMHGGVMDRVYFGGQVKQEDLPRFFRAADLYMSASYSDGTSISLLEALACGIPALVSDIPGNREWISPGAHGWLFKPGDSDAMAEGILRAVDQRKSLPFLGQAARKLAEKRANWELNFQSLLEAYEIARQRR